MHTKLISLHSFTLCLALATSSSLQGAQCDTQGGLRFVGTISDGSSSIWLSTTTAGSFKLDAAQGNQTVDTWTKERSGLHLSRSPIVSNGNGGTHKLYSSQNCLLDTSNQQGGISLPPSIIPPGAIKPVPPIGVLPPETIRPVPPIGVLPPETIRPVPPIGTLPPETIRPVPPIGTLPPETIRPVPPIGVLPPETIKPVPPIGVLPPETIRPVPPIGTLPPETIRPVPPIGVLPPETITPVPPIGVLPPETPTISIDTSSSSMQAQAIPSLPPCSMDDNTTARSDCYRETIPLTPGREFDTAHQWNFWVNANYIAIKDERGISEANADVRSLNIGADRLINLDTTAGLQLSINRGVSDSFNGEMRIETDDYTISPYMTYRFHPQWLIYGSIGVGQQFLDEHILTFDGSSEAILYTANLQIEGYYPRDNDIVLRPKLLTSYTYHGGDDYQLSGTLLNQSLTINTHHESMDYGVVQGSVEASRLFYIGNRTPILPYIEGGIFRQYANNDPQWGGFIRAGARHQLNDSWMASFDMGYESVGIEDLDVWNIQMLVSYAF